MTPTHISRYGETVDPATTSTRWTPRRLNPPNPLWG